MGHSSVIVYLAISFSSICKLLLSVNCLLHFTGTVCGCMCGCGDTLSHVLCRHREKYPAACASLGSTSVSLTAPLHSHSSAHRAQEACPRPKILKKRKGFSVQSSSVRSVSFLTGIRSWGRHCHNAGIGGVPKENMVAYFQFPFPKNTGQNVSLPVSWAKGINIMDLVERSGQSKWTSHHSRSQCLH